MAGNSIFDAWLEEHEPGKVEVVTGHYCGTCNQFYENGEALKPGWGVCMVESDTDEGEIAFVECYEGCMDWEPR